MSVKVAINGFGRIGRLALRRIVQTEGIEVVAINDLTPADMLAHLFKYDTTQGRFQGEVELKGDKLVVNGKEISVFAKPNPEELPWGELGIDVVLECTGFFTSKDKAEAHIRAGARKVVISAPGGDDVKTVVFNVNHQILDGSETVIQGLMTTVHGYTGDQNTLDAPHRKGDKRRARAAAENIIPNSTGAAKAIGLVIPELKGKLDGAAQRVPVATGSLTELVCVLEKTVSKEEINAAMKAAANESFGYTEDEIVSSDIIGMNFGSLFDATQTRVQTVGNSQLVKTVAWYDNEMSYASQLVRVLKYFAEKI